jgi:RNA polymerase sigma-70 factor, ECF subfamily
MAMAFIESSCCHRLPQIPAGRCCCIVNARGKALAEMGTAEAPFDFETFFYAHYDRTARAIARVIRDPARAEELAVEAFWKLWRHPRAHGEKAAAWLYRAAVRMALNELRRQTRSNRHESLAEPPPATPSPEQAHAAAEEQEHVRLVLAEMNARKAELLLLRASGLSYEELASALDVNAKSVGSLLSRAQQAFRKEYIKRYGEPGNEH